MDKDKKGKKEPSEDLADLAWESVQEKEEQQGDPIEVYAQRLRSHFAKPDAQSFRTRFLKGYKLLLDHLSKE